MRRQRSNALGTPPISTQSKCLGTVTIKARKGVLDLDFWISTAKSKYHEFESATLRHATPRSSFRLIACALRERPKVNKGPVPLWPRLRVYKAVGLSGCKVLTLIGLSKSLRLSSCRNFRQMVSQRFVNSTHTLAVHPGYPLIGLPVILSRIKKSPAQIPFFAKLHKPTSERRVALTAGQEDYWVNSLLDYYPRNLRDGVFFGITTVPKPLTTDHELQMPSALSQPTLTALFRYFHSFSPESLPRG